MIFIVRISSMMISKLKIYLKWFYFCAKLINPTISIREIQELITALEERIKDATQGNPVDLSATIPEFLTPSKLLEIRKEISKEICKKQQ